MQEEQQKMEEERYLWNRGLSNERKPSITWRWIKMQNNSTETGWRLLSFRKPTARCPPDNLTQFHFHYYFNVSVFMFQTCVNEVTFMTLSLFSNGFLVFMQLELHQKHIITKKHCCWNYYLIIIWFLFQIKRIATNILSK